MVPTIDGKRGNPVVWSRRFFPDLMALEGDIGARHLIGRYAEAVAEVPLDRQRGADRRRYPRGARPGQGRARRRLSASRRSRPQSLPAINDFGL